MRTSLLWFMSLAIVCVCGNTYAATYYVSPNGSDAAAGTRSSPWATFVRAMIILRPGDKLYLEDGTYDQQLNITKSGKSGSYITIKAINEGKVIIRTTYPASPLYLYNHSYIEVEDINFRNSGNYDPDVYCATSGNKYNNVHGLNISGADHITLRRVTAHGSSGCNSAIISLCGVTDSLLEDCAGSGQGRVVLNLIGCDNVTIRRCWLDWTGPSTGGGDTPSISQIYDSSHVLFENNVGLNMTTTPTDGLSIWAHYKNAAHNTMEGNIVYYTATYAAGGLRDTAEYGQHTSYGRIENNVSIVPVSGVYHSVPSDVIGTDHHTSKNNTYVGDGGGTGFFVHERPNRTSQTTDAVVKNSSFYNVGAGIYASGSGENTVTSHRYNNFYNTQTCLGNMQQMTPPYLDPTEKCNDINPRYATGKLGKGAFLMVPAALKGKGENGADIGASVLYRYQDGVLTGTPLWPWPMESRIVAEFGISPTWEAKGGIWKSLKGVYSLSKR